MTVPSEKRQSRYNHNPYLIRVITTRAAKEENEPIRGLTILKEELFVVSGKSSEIEVFDALKLTFCRRWKMKKLVDPIDIVSCKRNKRLYIMDIKSQGHSKTILVVNSNGKLLTEVRTGSDYGRLSITEELNVILTVCQTGKLNVYSSEGQLLIEIKLSPEVVHPQHAIGLNNGYFVVSHGCIDQDVHRVCIVDEGGQVKKSYGGKRGSDVGEMNIPNYLAVDKEGFVLVADQMNSRVLLLGPDLKLQREILSKSLRYPTKIYLNESSSQLMVVDNEVNSISRPTTCNDGQILIFNMEKIGL